MGCLNRQFARVLTTGGLALLLLPASQVYAQSAPTRLRGVPGQTAPAAPAAAAAQPAASQQPQAALPVSQPSTSMLQQPAQEAQIVLTDDTLLIHADNSSLSGILHQVASKSGMKIDGLGGDERVFGTFGPGAPRDVLADLLNGTAYNVVLLGDLSNGAPRELILTPASRGGAAAPAPPPQVSPDEASNEPENVEVPPPPPPDVAPAATTPPTPGVKTPQQLFEQLQRMRQAQQQQANPQQDPQQQQPPQ